MGRIPDSEIERLKQTVSLQRLAESRGVVLRKRGEELMGLCPFHDDHSPSLVINPAKNVWNCLGACQAGGSVIDWVMKAEGVSFRHAVELLRKDFSPLAADSEASGVVKRTTATKLDGVVEATADHQAQLRQVIEYYHETLKQSPEALAYLEKRGISSSEAIETFKLGYCNRTLGYHIPFKNRAAGSEIRSGLQAVGILRSSGHEHFRGSLVIPVIDSDGAIKQVYGRKIGTALRKGTPLHLYLPGPHRGVWNESALMASSEVILCESLIDALTFWCAGYRNVISSYGINGFTEEHLQAFRLYGIERVLIAYDRDEAGDKAASSLAEKLIAEDGIACFRIRFPKGMDANAYALSVQPASKSLGVVVRQAVWLGKGRAPAITSGAVSTEDVVKATKDEKGTRDAGVTELSNIECGRGLGGDTVPRDEGVYKGGASKLESLAPGRDASFEETVSDVHPTVSGRDIPVAESFPSLVAEDVTVEDTKSPRPPFDKGAMASPLPTPTPPQVNADVKNGEVTIHFGDRRWRARGLEKNMSFEVLRVNLLCARKEAFHVDTFDLYSAKHRQSYLKHSAQELSINEDVLKKDLGKVLLKLEELQEAQINQALNTQKEQAVSLSEEERQVAMKLLKSPDLLNRILSDFEKCGVVGEENNKLVGYLSAVSRKLEEPLAVVIQSSSAAGKSSLMEAILSFFPMEEQVKYSAMTGQSLFYMGETDLQHKILAIAEEEGAERASYALKLLQSEGELTIASTGKDPATGRLVTQEYRVEGPVMIFLTTTAIEIDEELLNRCIVLTVDEDREQTRAIHRLQRERQTLEGLLAQQDSAEIRKLHQDAQRLLRPLLVTNPFATELTFLDDRTRTRRDHMKYLTLIRSIALLHQYQRAVQTTRHKGQQVQYIEVSVEDIETANRLSHHVLGRSLDELAPQTRRLLTLLTDMVSERCTELEMEREDYRFSRREVRSFCGWSYEQVRVHLERLVNLEYLLVHQGSRGQSFVYELLFDGRPDAGAPHMMGLIDVEALRTSGTTKSLGGKSGSLGCHTGPIPGGYRDGDHKVSPNDSAGKGPVNGKTPKNAYVDSKKSPFVIPSLSRTDVPQGEAKKSEAL